MSQPPYSPDPNQPDYQQQQPQPYGAAPPPPAGHGSPLVARPGMVMTAAVIAFVTGALNLLGALIILLAGDTVAVSTGVRVVIGLLGLAFGAALIFGGMQAMSGRNQKILVITAGAIILLQLLSWALAGFAPLSLISIALAAVIIGSLLQQPSRDWFRAKGGSTF